VLDRLSLRGSAVALSVGAGARVEVRASELVGEVIVDGDVSVIEASLRDGGLVVGATGALAGDRLSTTSAPLTVSGGTLELAHAAMIGGDFAVAVESGGSGLLRESVVAGQTDHGIAARGADAELTATDVVITDVRDTMGGGSGVVLDDGAVFRASRLAIIRPGAVAFDVVGSEVDLRGVALIDSGIDTAANMGGGMYVTGGSHVEAVALSAESSRSVGIILFQSSGYFEDLVVLDTASVGTALDGGGFIVASSHVAVERGWIAGSALGGVMVSDPQAQLRLEDVHILDTRSASGSFGRGLSAQTGAKVTLRRVAIEDATADGIFAVRRGASVTGTDVTIRRTRAARAGPLVGIGMGIHVQSGAFVDLKRVEVVESVGFGVVLVYDGSRGRLRDLVVRDTRSWERPALGDSLWGRGIDLQSGAHLTLERAIVSNNRDVGIGLSEDCELVLADVVVRDTQDEGVLGHGGRGLAVYYPSVVRGARVLLERNKEAGLVAFAAGTQIELTDLEIRDTMEATCVATGCPAGGIGLGAYEESDVSIRRFIIADSALLGVQVAELGGLDLESGTVSGSPVGASVDVAGYDIGRLSNDVRYENNGTNLDSAALPVPIRGPTFESEGEM
jgi:hypothetical protein